MIEFINVDVDDAGDLVQFTGKSPKEVLDKFAAESETEFGSPEFASWMDAKDPLSELRSEFLFPQRNGQDVVYFVGNSLGLQPRGCARYIQGELDSWATRGVNGHFEGPMPWLNYDELLTEEQAKLVGALPNEIAVMNSLTVNLHLLLVRFFNPTTSSNFKRTKILVESRIFPSDLYAVESQLRLRGLDPATCIEEVKPRPGEHILRTQDIVEKISDLGDELALVMFPGVQFYTGQLFDVPAITRAAHTVGALAVWDMAHAAGNVDLKLHEWKVDGACWCTYKYLNSGPGGIGGFFVHERHFNHPTTDRLSGWWSHEVSTRFEMSNVYEPSVGASEFRLSNVPIMTSAALLSSLDVFKRTSMRDIRLKSLLLTQLLEEVLTELREQIPEGYHFDIITGPERGAQLSLLFKSDSRAKRVCADLEKDGVMVDYRKPGLVRAAPAPLYCSFTDVIVFRDLLKRVIAELDQKSS